MSLNTSNERQTFILDDTAAIALAQGAQQKNNKKAARKTPVPKKPAPPKKAALQNAGVQKPKPSPKAKPQTVAKPEQSGNQSKRRKLNDSTPSTNVGAEAHAVPGPGSSKESANPNIKGSRTIKNPKGPSAKLQASKQPAPRIEGHVAAISMDGKVQKLAAPVSDNTFKKPAIPKRKHSCIQEDPTKALSPPAEECERPSSEAGEQVIPDPIPIAVQEAPLSKSEVVKPREAPFLKAGTHGRHGDFVGEADLETGRGHEVSLDHLLELERFYQITGYLCEHYPIRRESGRRGQVSSKVQQMRDSNQRWQIRFNEIYPGFSMSHLWPCGCEKVMDGDESEEE